MADYTNAGARISKDGRYRYRLWREWRGTHDVNNWRWFDRYHEYGEPKPCVFIMLNPSTADGNTDDPTIRRCVAFAKSWNYERLVVVNLFAYRATNPRELLALNDIDDPVGPDNYSSIEDITAKAGITICAWGTNGSHLGQDETVRGWIVGKTHSLGLTKHGYPRHPLYLPADTKPIPYD